MPSTRSGTGLFDELKAAGYLQMTRKLAGYAPATALALNMHHYWVGLAADLWRSGDKSVEWILEASTDGKVFAAGHSESGNDLPLLLSSTEAKPNGAGYHFTGRKSFGSLTPAWDWLGIHGMDTSDPDAPKIVVDSVKSKGALGINPDEQPRWG